MSFPNINFSLWCDFIQKDFLEGEFQNLVDSGLINGATSNPSIFAQALKNPSYLESIKSLKGKKAKEIYEALAITDIRRAAQILKPLWEKNDANGFISLEIDPFLCDEVAQSVDEGVRLYKSIAMPNVMIKVPATPAGYEVMNALSSKGISINATLIFTPTQAKECAQALKSGFSKVLSQAHAPQGVISVFVSRFDRVVDSKITQSKYRAQMGIINAMDCYECIEGFAQSNIRTLFASTGVKGGDLSSSYYIDKLILPHSVNTAPLETLKAYEQSTDKMQKSLLDSQSRLGFWQALADMGLSREEISQNLLTDGLVSFKQSFEELLKNL